MILGNSALARAACCHQTTEIWKNLRKENVHSHWCAVQGSPVRVCNLPQLLQISQIRGEARLQVREWWTKLSAQWHIYNYSCCFQLPPAIVPEPFPPPRLYLRLRLRLEHAQVRRKPRPWDRGGAEICEKMRVGWGGAVLSDTWTVSLIMQEFSKQLIFKLLVTIFQ